jgi:hypothetical protein
MPLAEKPKWEHSHGVHTLRAGLLTLICEFKASAGEDGGFVVTVNGAKAPQTPTDVAEAKEHAFMYARQMMNRTRQLLDAAVTDGQ